MELKIGKKVKYNGGYVEGGVYLTVGRVYEIYNVFEWNKHESFYIMDDDFETLPIFKEEFSSFDEVY